jgi:hypothetical protein
VRPASPLSSSLYRRNTQGSKPIPPRSPSAKLP